MKVGTLFLFPLSKLDSWLKDYFVSVDGKFFSTKQSVDGRQMQGAGCSTPYLRSYTMAGMSREGSSLYRRAKQHVDFILETRMPAPVVSRPVDARTLRGSPADRSHAKSVDEGLAGKGWVIAQVESYNGQQFLQFGSKPTIHLSDGSVKAEMKRLATMKPGVKFVSLKVDSTVVTGGVVWE